MKNLYVFSNQRRMLEFLKQSDREFLSNVLSIEEFFSQALLVKDKKKAPRFLQKVFLAQVFKEFEFDDREKQFLFFEHNFLGFLETSSFLLKFFREIFESRVEIKEITELDVYGEYEDHLKVITKINESYQNKLNLAGYYDLAYGAEIFWDFLDSFDRIEFFISGVLSRFELMILSKIAEKIPVFLHFSIDFLNLSLFSLLSSSFQVDHVYCFCLSSGEILTQMPKKLKNSPSLRACDSAVDECARVIERVNHWLSNGVDPEKIAVVVSNHEILPLLMVCDEAGNFNYAMGNKADFAQYFDALTAKEYQGLEDLIAEIESRIPMVSPSLASRFDRVLLDFQQSASFLKGFDFKELVRLFLEEIEDFREDDNKGGKVRVIELLETRDMEFEKVIVVDFDQDHIPSLSNQDMFLNTSVRKRLGMPTIEDKQKLQKHYYLELFKNASEVELLFLKGKMAHFAHELSLSEQTTDDLQIYPTLFPPHHNYSYQEDEINAQVPDEMVFSPTNLRVFEECRRKFYFRYLCKLKEEQSDETFDQGFRVHEILRRTYEGIEDFSQLQNRVMGEFTKLQEELEGYRSQMRYRIVARELQEFLRDEMRSPPDEILCLEKKFEFEFEGYRLQGITDRIDRKGNVIRIIDYKFSKHKAMSKKFDAFGIQATIYFLYARDHLEGRGLGEDIEVHFMFLKSNRRNLYDQERLEKNLDELKGLLLRVKEEREFPKTDRRNECRQCIYKILCNR